MRYLGGKSWLAKRFAHILDASLKETGGNFIEPFLGGMNILPALSKARIALLTDIHPGLISLYDAVQEGWSPPTNISKSEYLEMQKVKRGDLKSTFASFACSYGGKEWGGYARESEHSARAGRNYAEGASKRLLSKFPIEINVCFFCCSYEDLPIPYERVTYYCDPPYRNTTKYRTDVFDHSSFYEWCENLQSLGHHVFVSEFNAPDHWEVVWQVDRSVTCSKQNYKKNTDKLFRVCKREEVE